MLDCWNDGMWNVGVWNYGVWNDGVMDFWNFGMLE